MPSFRVGSGTAGADVTSRNLQAYPPLVPSTRVACFFLYLPREWARSARRRYPCLREECEVRKLRGDSKERVGESLRPHLCTITKSLYYTLDSSFWTNKPHYLYCHPFSSQLVYSTLILSQLKIEEIYTTALLQLLQTEARIFRI